MKSIKKYFLAFMFFLAVFLVLIFYFKNHTVFRSVDAFRNYIETFGSIAPIVYVLIQMVQVIIAPIPGNITTIAGGMTFGWLLGFILGHIGVVFGSLIVFIISRKYGVSFVIKLIGKEKYYRYKSLLKGKQNIVLFLIFLVPFFPDDVLCLVAGLTPISLPMFLFIVLIARIPSTLFSALIGSGVIQLEIWHWVLIACISIVVIYIFFKYNSKIEDKISNVFTKRNGYRK